MKKTCCGPTTARTSSTSTTAAWGRQCRACGCCCRASASTACGNWTTYSAGYEDFCEFDARELHLVEALRTLRLILYAAWLAQRRDDPAFKRAFPWFNTQRYWQCHILELREQIAAMDEPPLWQDWAVASPYLNSDNNASCLSTGRRRNMLSNWRSMSFSS